MLVAALEEAKPGDRILVANYSDGADAFSLKVTDEIEKIRNRRGIKGYLKSKYAFPNYGKYIIFRDLMEFEAERRADFSALSHYMRERNQFLRFHGGRCKTCGTLQHPIQRVCAVCQTKDNYDEVRLAETTGTIFSFAMDERAMVKDLPNVFVIVDLDGGGRYAGVLTDRIPSEVKVGMKVEMTLRNQHDGAGFHNYSWKARPVRA
jgi:hydroxymethylglutaryl-CoA synthase